MIEEHKGEITGKSIPKEDQYHGPLFREVHRTKRSPFSPEWDNNLCYWCQEEFRIRTDPDVIIWCHRCYALQYKRPDGTYIKHTNYTIGKDLQDIQNGIVKANFKLAKPDSKVINDD